MASIYWATKTVSYGPFNAPCITQGNKFSTLVYGPNQERIKHSDSNGRVTKYVGGIYEEVTKAGVTQKIHYVGDFALVTQTGGVTPVIKHEYLHRDHIGSIVAISKSTVASANDVQWQSNGAWGERRYQQWNGPLDNLLNPDSTAKGFTDHEHLDAVGLIHMNGRVYDPELGRFMSADPFVQAPYNSQSYNRYSYVFNNPLSFTDPTGYFGQGSGCDDQGCITYPSGGCASGASCMTGDSAWQFMQQWSASENRGEQWSYQGGAAYNIADFWGKVAFDLAAGDDGRTNKFESSFSYENWLSQQNFMSTNPWDGAVWATGYNIDQQMTKVMSGMASVVPVGYGVAWGGRLLGFFKFGKAAKGTALPDKYWIRDKKSLEQITPGIRVLNDYKKASSSGGTYHQSTHYDKFGRLIGRTDRTSHGDSSVHPNPHHHRIDPVTGERLKAPDGSRVWPGLFGN